MQLRRIPRSLLRGRLFGTKEVVDRTVSLLTDRFSRRLFVFDGVEIGGIRRQVFQGVTGLMEGVLDVLAFVESGVVQDNHGGGRQLGEEDLVDPGEEDLGVDAGFKKADGDEPEAPEGADDVDAPLGVPVPLSVTALPDGCVTEPARHVPGKSALVDPNACSPRRLIRRSPGLKGTPRGGVWTPPTIERTSYWNFHRASSASA